jgi:glycosyltransferase involved in cell wall biosynthesis
MPFFSVVIPLYNKANFIKATLQSLSLQSFKDHEVIIVDDGSTDGSLDTVQHLKKDNYKIIEQANQGVSNARNNGVKAANGEWVAFLDADDLWQPDHLSELKRCIDTLQDVSLVSNAYKIKLKSDFKKTPVFSKTPSDDIAFIEEYLAYSFVDPLFWTSSIAVNREDFLSIGGFDEDLKTGEDLDLMIRFSDIFKIGYNPTYTIIYNRVSENNLSDFHNLSEKKKYIDKHRINASSNAVLKKYLDINRYSLALQAKMSLNKDIFRVAVSEIDKDNLNKKQKILLSLPGFVLISLKRIQLFMIRMGIYKSAFT